MAGNNKRSASPLLRLIGEDRLKRIMREFHAATGATVMVMTEDAEDVADNEARYWRAAGIEERYAARDGGVQQTFVLYEPVVTADGTVEGGDLVIEGVFDTYLEPVFVSPDEGVLFYLPGAPTFVDLGFPKVVFATEQFLMAPPKLPDDKRKVLEAAAEKAVADSEFLALSKKQGFSVDPKSSAKATQAVLETFEYVTEVLIAAGEMKK